MENRKLMIDPSQLKEDSSRGESGQSGKPDEPSNKGVPFDDDLRAIAEIAANEAKASNTRDLWNVCDHCLDLLASHSMFNRQLGNTAWDVGLSFLGTNPEEIANLQTNIIAHDCGFCKIAGFFNSDGRESAKLEDTTAATSKQDYTYKTSISYRLKKYANPLCSISFASSNDVKNLGRYEIENVENEPDNRFWTHLEIYNLKNQSHVSTPSALRELAAHHGEPDFEHYRLPPNLHDIAGYGLDQAREWVENCKNGHPECRLIERNLDMPQFLVHITSDTSNGSTYDLKLIETDNNIPLDYVALSYCWGTADAPHITTITNCKTRLAGFRSSYMPASIRDAVLVTRRLGLSYLWIDSLCILQDSPDQKMREILKIASIFSGAYVTIVAACSRSVNEGFLFKVRNPEKEPPKYELKRQSDKVDGEWSMHIYPEQDPIAPFKVPHWDEQGNLSTLELRKVPFYFGYDPVHTRGWTLEEWMLSRRRIVFTRQQIAWICESGIDWDGGYSAPGTSPYKKVGNFASQLLFHIEQRLTDNTLSVENDLMSLVEIYTNRFFQHKDDRLLALNGVMQKLERVFNKTLVAGCWAEDLIDFLLWRIRDSSEDFEMMKARLYYMNGPKRDTETKVAYGNEILEVMAEAYKVSVDFDTLAIDYSKGKFDSVPSWSWLSAKTGWVHFEGRKAKEKTCWISGIAVEGGCAKPRLFIKGALVRNWHPPPPLSSGCSKLCGNCPTCALAHDMESKVSHQRVFFDYSAVTSTTLCLLPIQRNLATHWISGLIVFQTPTESSYSRVGFFEIISDIFLEYEYEEGEITLT